MFSKLCFVTSLLSYRRRYLRETEIQTSSTTGDSTRNISIQHEYARAGLIFKTQCHDRHKNVIYAIIKTGKRTFL